jgi:hypothetical protein
VRPHGTVGQVNRSVLGQAVVAHPTTAGDPCCEAGGFDLMAPREGDREAKPVALVPDLSWLP